MIHAHCPETRDLTEWPMFWALVAPGSGQETVHLTIEHPKETHAAA